MRQWSNVEIIPTAKSAAELLTNPHAEHLTVSGQMSPRVRHSSNNYGLSIMLGHLETQEDFHGRIVPQSQNVMTEGQVTACQIAFCLQNELEPVLAAV